MKLLWIRQWKGANLKPLLQPLSNKFVITNITRKHMRIFYFIIPVIQILLVYFIFINIDTILIKCSNLYEKNKKGSQSKNTTIITPQIKRKLEIEVQFSKMKEIYGVDSLDRNKWETMDQEQWNDLEQEYADIK